MRVMSQSLDTLARMHTMTKRQGKSGTIDVKALLREDEIVTPALTASSCQLCSKPSSRSGLGYSFLRG